MDVDLHLIIPYTTETLITQVTDEINEIKENALEKFEQAIHSNNNFSKLETIYFKLKNNITYTHQNKQPRASYEVQYQMDSCDDLKISGKSVILYWDIKMHDLKANIPFSTPELSYLSNTMIRPIVSYLNSNKNVTNVSFSTEVDLGNFNGSWGLYESGIVDILSIEIGKGINHIVGHDLSSFEAWRNMSFWGVQYLSRQILAVLGGVKGLTRYSYTGPDGSMWYYQHEYLN